eukprot:NODE_362_length_2878_cov_29.473684_g307_i0.p1 GENE.NODE_362_length_2878_cov_29.473684_g307_i0~~NODE_362_length_2878_cov_29.473684_g307_i0.p1  ORF type:complete len:712 (-),score=87.32 NODE_362_length_2878_cov_29.473684_g307_i0:663-2798(-)
MARLSGDVPEALFSHVRPKRTLQIDKLKGRALIASLFTLLFKIAPLGILIGASYLISRVSFLLFHSLAELFSIHVAFTTATLAFHTRKISDNPVLLALGCSYWFTGLLDLVHMLAYKGMNVMVYNKDPNAATQLWVSARFLESGSMALVLIIGNFLKQKKWLPWVPSLLLTISTTLILCSIFWWNNFPVCFDDGLTPFKVISEYVICGIWLIVFITITRPWWPSQMESIINYNLPNMGKECHEWLFLGVLSSILAEVMFTLYADVFGLINIVGHCAKITAYWSWYQAIILEMLEDPYTVLFSSICSTNNELLNTKQALYSELQSARKACRDRNAFMAMMSHELRTPLNGISGLMEMIENSELDNEQRQQVQTVRGAIECMTVVINDLLDFFKLEAGKVNLECIPISVTDLAHSVMELYRQKITPNVTISVSGPADIKYIGDPTRIRQVLCNLVSNSVKFTTNGRITLTVIPMEKDEFTDCGVEFILEDTGPGIPEDKLQKLFQPFVQADETISRKFGGTGLGLHIVKQLVDLMGGTISVHSEINYGSTFRVKFPLPIETQGGSPLCAYPICPAMDNRFTDFVVVAVDDTPLNLKVLHAFGKRVGCEITSFTSGQQAIEFFTVNKADLCLMDIWMPGLSGVETTKRLRSMGVTIPIVALTADTNADPFSSGYTDFNRIAHKPLRFNEFVDVLNMFYNERVTPISSQPVLEIS